MGANHKLPFTALAAASLGGCHETCQSGGKFIRFLRLSHVAGGRSFSHVFCQSGSKFVNFLSLPDQPRVLVGYHEARQSGSILIKFSRLGSGSNAGGSGALDTPRVLPKWKQIIKLSSAAATSASLAIPRGLPKWKQIGKSPAGRSVTPHGLPKWEQIHKFFKAPCQCRGDPRGVTKWEQTCKPSRCGPGSRALASALRTT